MKTLKLNFFSCFCFICINIIFASNSIAQVTGSGTIDFIPKWTGTTSIGNSQIRDNSTSVAIGGAPNNIYKLSSITPVMSLNNGQISSYYGSSFAYSLTSNLVASSQMYGSRIITSTSTTQRGSGIEGNIIPYLARNQNSSSNVYSSGSLNTIEFPSSTIIPSGSLTTGGYYLGGSISILTGVNQSLYPSKGAYSAVIGIDQINSDGTFAGYFEGKGYFNDNIKIATLQRPLNLVHDSRIYALTRNPNHASYAGFFEIDFRNTSWGDNATTAVTGWSWGGLISNKGVEGFAQGRCDNNSVAFGTIGRAQDAKVNYGVYGGITNEFCTGTTNYAGYFAGNLAYTGSLINLSDKKFKTEIEPLYNNLDIITKLEPVSYKYINTYNNRSLSLPEGIHFGFISQEVEKIIPNLVEISFNPTVNNNHITNDELIEYRGLKYMEIIPLLVGAVKELNEKLDSITQYINSKTEKEIKEVPSQNKIDNFKEASLFVFPNPSKTNLSIEYTVDFSSNSQVSIKVYDVSQKIMFEKSITEMSGKIDLNVTNYNSGVYFVHLQKNNITQKIVKIYKD